MAKALTLLSCWNHPTEHTYCARDRDDAVKSDAPTKVELDGVRGRDNQVVHESVISAIHQQGIVH